MTNNEEKNNFLENELALIDIFKFLMNSKILIITITLVITALSAIYSFQKKPVYYSAALIEIGNYEIDEFDQKQFEHANTLINELTIDFIFKQEKDLKIQSVKDKLIQISSTSPSSVTSKNLLNEVMEYIENRHSFMLKNHFQRAQNDLTNEINFLNNKIKQHLIIIEQNKERNKLLKERERIRTQNLIPLLDYTTQQLNNESLDVLNSIELLKTQYNYLPEPFWQTNFSSNEIIDFKHQKHILELKLKFMEEKRHTSSRFVGKIVTNELNTSKVKPILLSFILGLFLSIFIAFFINFLKTLKEEHV